MPSLVEIGPVVLKKMIFKVGQCILAISLLTPLGKGWSPWKFESPSLKDALCQAWLKLALWFFRRIFLKLVNVILQLQYHLPLEKGMALNFNKFESQSPMDALCQVWLKLALWFLRRRIFNVRHCIFVIFVIISP